APSAETETPYAHAPARDDVDRTYPTPTDPIYNDRGIANNPAYVDRDPNYAPNATIGDPVPGVQTGGRTIDGRPDSRGILEKSSDFVTGDTTDDKQGVPVHHDNRGVGEKVADAVTGDRIDDKTGRVVR
ncbi:MAG: hypothetical protein SFU56_06645, partial [Capsulimonadales bacterium]|nr:hypothetical protein [Capsulimonadales bacterium]